MAVWTFRLCLFYVCFALANTDGRHSNLQDVIWQYNQQSVQSQSTGNVPIDSVWQYYQQSVQSQPTGNVPFVGPEVPAMYCAYCRQRGWTECINRYCFQQVIIPFSFPGNFVPPTRSFGFHGNNAIAAGRFGFRRRLETSGSYKRLIYLRPEDPVSKYGQ